MTLIQVINIEFVGKTVLLVILLPFVSSRPWTHTDDNNIIGDEMSDFGDNIIYEKEVQKAINNYLYNKEHTDLRKMLKLAISILDNKDELIKESEVLNTSIEADMPFYFDHIKSLVSGEVRKRRNHRRRGAFDSIAHRAGGLGGLGGSYTGRKEKYTLEQLLPFIIAELRKNKNFGVPKFHL